MATLYSAKMDAVWKAMMVARIESQQVVCAAAGINKNTMTVVMHDGLVKKEVLEKIGRALNVDWQSLHRGCIYVPRGQGQHGSKQGNDVSSEVIDLLAAFGSLVAYQTSIDPNEVRSIAYVYSERPVGLRRLAGFTGGRPLIGEADLIPCSPRARKTDEDSWFIISRAFSGNQYVCENVDWKVARRHKFQLAQKIWQDVQGVAAHPIRPRHSTIQPVGAVCVDIARTVQECKWAENGDLQKTLESLGGILYLMITKRGLL